jgi:ParB family transcriptional regulator, chromosome partitioning protein
MATNVVEKKDEKVEKRRALGRGLASLLPGPRVVTSTEVRVPGNEREDSKHDASDERADQAHGGNTAQPRPAPAAEAPAAAIRVDAANVVEQLELESIERNPYQTRYMFDEQMLKELAESIKANGVVQPIVVRPAEKEGRYVLVLGERRLRASKLAGKETVPALVKRLSLQQAAEMTVLENIQRQDLNALEQAEAFRVLSTEFQLTQAQIAERIGVSRETVSNYMRLLRLPEEVMQYILEGKLSFSEAREILSLDNLAQISQVAKEAIEKQWKLEQIEERIRELNGFTGPGDGTGQKKAGRSRWMDPNVRAAQTEMERTLGMRVRISDRNGKGKIVIEYATVDDYQRVVERLNSR